MVNLVHMPLGRAQLKVSHVWGVKKPLLKLIVGIFTVCGFVTGVVLNPQPLGQEKQNG